MKKNGARDGLEPATSGLTGMRIAKKKRRTIQTACARLGRACTENRTAEGPLVALLAQSKERAEIAYLAYLGFVMRRRGPKTQPLARMSFYLSTPADLAAFGEGRFRALCDRTPGDAEKDFPT